MKQQKAEADSWKRWAALSHASLPKPFGDEYLAGELLQFLESVVSSLRYSRCAETCPKYKQQINSARQL